MRTLSTRTLLIGSFGLSLLAVASAFGAAEVREVKVTGENSADIQFVVDGASDALPGLAVNGNAIELVFSGTGLAEALQGKAELSSPHTLVQRVSVIPSDKGGARARILVNGSIEGLRNRAQLVRTPDGYRLSLAYPKAENATLELLKEEQKPLTAEVKSASANERSGWGRIAVVLFLFVGTGVGTFYLARFLKKKSAWRGSRKFLVESIAYCPVGPGGKQGVSLIKVGREFVLVGVTPNQVNLLSTLPKLQQQYEDETRFERDTFKDAVEHEVARMKVRNGSGSGVSA